MNPFHAYARPITIVAGSVFALAHLLVFAATATGEMPSVATTGFYRWSCVLLLAGFVGLAFAAVALHARQEGRGGALGLIGLVGALTGTVLMAGDWWFETFAVPFYASALPQMFEIEGGGWLGYGGLTSYLTFALGWAILGYSCLRSGAVPMAAGIALLIGGLIGYGAVAPPNGFALGAAIVWAGITLRNQAAVRV